MILFPRTKRYIRLGALSEAWCSKFNYSKKKRVYTKQRMKVCIQWNCAKPERPKRFSSAAVHCLHLRMTRGRNSPIWAKRAAYIARYSEGTENPHSWSNANHYHSKQSKQMLVIQQCSPESTTLNCHRLSIIKQTKKKKGPG